MHAGELLLLFDICLRLLHISGNVPGLNFMSICTEQWLMMMTYRFPLLIDIRTKISPMNLETTYERGLSRVDPLFHFGMMRREMYIS